MRKLTAVLTALLTVFLGLVACDQQLYEDRYADGYMETEVSTKPITEDLGELPDIYIVQKNEYHQDGRILKEVYFDLENDGCVSEVTRIEYAYDNSGNLVSENIYFDSSSSGTTTKSYEYDSNNRLHKVYSYDYLSVLYEYDDQGNLTNKYFYDSRGNLTDSEEYIYNNSLLFSAAYMYSNYDSVEDTEGNYQEVIQRNYYYEEYDTAGRLSKSTFFYHDEEPYYELYTYSNHETIIQEYSLAGTPGLRTTLDYDNQNRKVRHLITYPDGEIWSLYEYEYTDHSRKSITYDSDGTIKYYDVEITDEFNRLIFEASYDAEGKLRASWEYIYDDNGYVASIINTDQNGSVNIEIAPHRDFYSNGNVKTEVFYNNENYIAPIYRGRYQSE